MVLVWRRAQLQDYANLALVQDLTSSKDLRTSACTTCKAPSPVLRAMLKDVPNEIMDRSGCDAHTHERACMMHAVARDAWCRYYGCGTPLPLGIEGLRVLDLGSGTGRDCYVAARIVGPQGFVTGVGGSGGAMGTGGAQRQPVRQRHMQQSRQSSTVGFSLFPKGSVTLSPCRHRHDP